MYFYDVNWLFELNNSRGCKKQPEGATKKFCAPRQILPPLAKILNTRLYRPSPVYIHISLPCTYPYIPLLYISIYSSPVDIYIYPSLVYIHISLHCIYIHMSLPSTCPYNPALYISIYTSPFSTYSDIPPPPFYLSGPLCTSNEIILSLYIILLIKKMKEAQDHQLVMILHIEKFNWKIDFLQGN